MATTAPTGNEDHPGQQEGGEVGNPAVEQAGQARGPNATQHDVAQRHLARRPDQQPRLEKMSTKATTAVR